VLDGFQDLTYRRATKRMEGDNVDQEVPPQVPAQAHPQAPITKVEEYPQEFIDEVYKVLAIVGVTSVEKVELASYHLKWVAQIWFNQWKEARPVEAGPIEWERFKSDFLERFSPLHMREAKVLEFISLRQGNMSIKEYALRFTQQSKYAPSIVVDRRAKMSKFVSEVSDMVVKECRIAILVHDTNISHLMVHVQ